jgi:hypothetical protein
LVTCLGGLLYCAMARVSNGGMEVLHLEDLPTWPLPPPSPPGDPPLPPPNRLLNASSHLECNFEVDTDLSITSAGAGQGAQHLTDSRMQCCALCAMRRSCRNFVFMPDSSICALLPVVPTEQIVRTSNPGTVAGTVFVSHVQTQEKVVEHAKCSYEVGRAYSQGSFGQALSPVDGSQRITSQQARARLLHWLRHPIKCVAKHPHPNTGGPSLP